VARPPRVRARAVGPAARPAPAGHGGRRALRDSGAPHHWARRPSGIAV